MAAHASGAHSSFGGWIDDFFLFKSALLTLGCEVFAFSYRHLMLSLDIRFELTSLIVHYWYTATFYCIFQGLDFGDLYPQVLPPASDPSCRISLFCN